MNTPLNTTEYREFIREIKNRIQSAQLKAAVSVNQELLRLYWDLAERIIARQQASAWGDGILGQISHDLQSEFPDMKGFSRRNLELMRQWYRFWSGTNAIAKQAATQSGQSAIAQQAVSQLDKTAIRQQAAAQFENSLFGQQAVAQIPLVNNFGVGRWR